MLCLADIQSMVHTVDKVNNRDLLLKPPSMALKYIRPPIQVQHRMTIYSVMEKGESINTNYKYMLAEFIDLDWTVNCLAALSLCTEY